MSNKTCNALMFICVLKTKMVKVFAMHREKFNNLRLILQKTHINLELMPYVTENSNFKDP